MARFLKLIGTIALVAVAGSLLLQWTVPASSFGIASAGVAFGLAVWIVPPVLLLIPRKKPRTSLAAVGFNIGLMVIGCCLSVAALSLSLVTFIGGEHNDLAWFSLLATTLFWPSAFALLNVAHRLPRDQRKS